MITATSLERWNGLDAAAVRAMLDAHLAGRRDFGLPLFLVVSVLLFLEGRARA